MAPPPPDWRLRRPIIIRFISFNSVEKELSHQTGEIHDSLSKGNDIIESNEPLNIKEEGADVIFKKAIITAFYNHDFQSLISEDTYQLYQDVPDKQHFACVLLIGHIEYLMIAYVSIQAVFIGVPQTETEYYLEGFVKDRATCLQNVGTVLQGMGYGSIKHTVPITKQQIDNYLNVWYYQIYATRSHGGYDLNSGSLIDTYLGLGDNGLYTSVDLSYHDLSHIQLMVFVGCYTGYHPSTDPTSTNTLVDVAVEQGAVCAVGFQPVIDYYAANSWVEAFFDGLSEGHTVLYTCNYLSTVYLNQETNPNDDFGVDEYVIRGNSSFTLPNQ